MPIYMDLHTLPGVTAKEVAEAHQQDVSIQDRFFCRAMTYWIDEGQGSVFCLIEAPDKESVRRMHEHSHGLVPNEIIEVKVDVVNAFLGRIKDPDKVEETSTPDLKVFNDPAFRILMVAKAKDARLLRLTLGINLTQELLLVHNTIVRDQLKIHDGREVEMREEGFVASFRSVASAIACSLEIQQKMSLVAGQVGLHIGIHAGVPVNKSEELFGEALKFANYLCSIGNDNQIIMSSSVRKLYKEDAHTGTINQNIRWLSHSEESFLEGLIETLENHWQDPQFGITDFCEAMSMSKPQLYRKSVGATGMSPNTLLREYRLHRSLDLLRSEDRNVSQTTFDTGFSSPSYFTKCFQKRFGLQPMAYLKART
ncbi:MAG TPA: nickel-binding protein [Chryseolinea sp.]|nr:nickel-binding protein [Chryseolinea sp.]